MIAKVLAKLEEEYGRCRGALVAFSGGVDSTLLLALFKKILGDRVVAATVVFPYLSSRHVENARKLAKLIGVRHYLLDGAKIMEVGNFRFNPANRCYICKKYIYRALKDLAEEEIDVIVDGTNFDDLGEDRPGLKALKEEGVRTPLADLKLNKEKVRLLARQLDLPNWNAPPTTCLLTRLPFGVEITLERLSRIEKAEELIVEVVGGTYAAVRVRDYMDTALIEVSRNYLGKIFAERNRIVRELKNLGFKKVALDLEGYRRF